jgi:hypothetical protein
VVCASILEGGLSSDKAIGLNDVEDRVTSVGASFISPIISYFIISLQYFKINYLQIFHYFCYLQQN